jgi:hypothetical protein
MINTYNNDFTCWHDVVTEFTGTTYPITARNEVLSKFPEPDKVYFADYDTDGYEGRAVVIWRDKGKYYYLEGSHCSCYGLEETGFNPEVFETKELFLAYLERYCPWWMETIKDDLIKEIKEDN